MATGHRSGTRRNRSALHCAGGRGYAPTRVASCACSRAQASGKCAGCRRGGVALGGAGCDGVTLGLGSMTLLDGRRWPWRHEVIGSGETWKWRYGVSRSSGSQSLYSSEDSNRPGYRARPRASGPLALDAPGCQVFERVPGRRCVALHRFWNTCRGATCAVNVQQRNQVGMVATCTPQEALTEGGQRRAEQGRLLDRYRSWGRQEVFSSPYMGGRLSWHVASQLLFASTQAVGSREAGSALVGAAASRRRRQVCRRISGSAARVGPYSCACK